MRAIEAALVLVMVLAWPSGGECANAPRWEVGVDAGIVRTVATNPIFRYATKAEGYALRRLGGRWSAGVYSTFLNVIDSEPANAFWYGGVGGRLQLGMTERLRVGLELGWEWRHIGLSDGYSNTVGGPAGAVDLGVSIISGRSWRLGLAASYRCTSQFVATKESFVTSELGIGLRVAWIRW